MDDKLFDNLQPTGQNAKSKRNKWKTIVRILSCIVVFCTTYALIIPAITLNNKCEIEEHTHSDDCFEETIITPSSLNYSCSLELHKHTDTCYNEEHTLICGMADYIIHKHNELCYYPENNLVCTIHEVSVNAEGIEGYDPEKPTVQVHKHETACYDENKTLICGLLETEEHIHTNECAVVTQAETEQKLICETAEHTHDSSCTIDKENPENNTVNEDTSEDKNDISSYALKNEPAVIAEDPYNLVNYITTVTLERRPAGESTWIPVTDGKLQTGDALRFDIQYNIPGKVLSSDHPTVTYQVPLTATKAESGDVYNGNEIVGTYSITESGFISITFNDEYVKKNADGADISGHIAFESSVNAINTDSAGNGNLVFKDNITIQVTDKTNNTNDLQVTKTAAEINNANGTLNYTIKVTSEKGTNGSVTLNDVLSQLVVNGDIVIKDKNGNVINTIKDQNGKDSFTLELPEMEANDSYTITYSAQLKNAETLNGSVTANNKVDVTSKDSNGGILVDEDDVSTNFVRDIIAKSGKLEGNTITWTITVNTSKIDISKWVLSDILNNTAYTGNVTITPNPNTGSGSLTAILPYTFPDGSNKTYTITYKTTVDSGTLGNISYTNAATLTPPGGSGITGSDQVHTTSVDPLTKEAIGVIVGSTETDGDKLAHYNWRITIDAKNIGITPYLYRVDEVSRDRLFWYFSDELWTEATHWITRDQLLALDSSLRNAYPDLDFEIITYEWSNTDKQKYDGEVKLSETTNAGKYRQFRILFYSPLAPGEKIIFEYASTGNIKDGTSSKDLTNRADINNKTYEQASQKYNPVVRKVDKIGNTNKDTTHDFSNLKPDNSGRTGILGWDVYVQIPTAVLTHDLIITEQIPEHTHLLEDNSNEWALSFALDFFNDEFHFTNSDGSATITKTKNEKKYSVTAQHLDNKYIITVPSDLANMYLGKQIKIEVRVRIDDDFNWDTVSKTFKNVVIVTTNGIELGQASQAQTIVKPAVSKSSGNVTNNTIPYSLELNPNGLDLVPGSDTLTLTDTLTYTKPESGTVNALLNVNSVKVYRIESDNSKTDITAACPFTFTETDTGTSVRKVITMTIPDGVPLQFEYSYRFSGNNGVTIDISNTAAIEGKSGTEDEEKHDIQVSIQQSNAGATLVGVELHKVDAENYAIVLEGAVFDLKKWDASQEKYVTIKTYTTGKDGSFHTDALEPNIAYQLVETSSPFGYSIDPTPYSFYIAGSGTEVSQPTDFNGVILNNGDSIIITNAKVPYELPETGGHGTLPYTICAIALLGFCIFSVLYINSCHKKTY